MLLDITIKRARLCTKSSQLFSMAEDLSQQISDSESTLNLAEYAYNWSWVEAEVKTLAVLKYAYKTIHGWAEDMDDEEAFAQQSAEMDAAMCGDRV